MMNFESGLRYSPVQRFLKDTAIWREPLRRRVSSVQQTAKFSSLGDNGVCRQTKDFCWASWIFLIVLYLFTGLKIEDSLT